MLLADDVVERHRAVLQRQGYVLLFCHQQYYTISIPDGGT
jgi:hypothetical protein